MKLKPSRSAEEQASVHEKLPEADSYAAGIFHRVAAGDTMRSLAKRFYAARGVSTALQSVALQDMLLQSGQLSPSRTLSHYVGEVVELPSPEALMRWLVRGDSAADSHSQGLTTKLRKRVERDHVSSVTTAGAFAAGPPAPKSIRTAAPTSPTLVAGTSAWPAAATKKEPAAASSEHGDLPLEPLIADREKRGTAVELPLEPLSRSTEVTATDDEIEHPELEPIDVGRVVRAEDGDWSVRVPPEWSAQQDEALRQGVQRGVDPVAMVALLKVCKDQVSRLMVFVEQTDVSGKVLLRSLQVWAALVNGYYSGAVAATMAGQPESKAKALISDLQAGSGALLKGAIGFLALSDAPFFSAYDRKLSHPRSLDFSDPVQRGRLLRALWVAGASRSRDQRKSLEQFDRIWGARAFAQYTLRTAGAVLGGERFNVDAACYAELMQREDLTSVERRLLRAAFDTARTAAKKR